MSERRRPALRREVGDAELAPRAGRSTARSLVGATVGEGQETGEAPGAPRAVQLAYVGMQNSNTTPPICRVDTGERTRLRAAPLEGKDTERGRRPGAVPQPRGVGSLVAEGSGAGAAALLGMGMGQHEGRQMSRQPTFVAA